MLHIFLVSSQFLYLGFALFSSPKSSSTLLGEMTRQKIQLKKIENTTARQVTFSKRRKGLFKKAQELSLLCDAEIALIVFSSNGKLFDFTNSRSMEQVLQQYHRQSENLELHQPCLGLQLESRVALLRKEAEEKTHELRMMNGEELTGLSAEELGKLEEMLKAGQNRVQEIKNKRFFREITTLGKKKFRLMEENKKLKLQMVNMSGEQVQIHEQYQSSMASTNMSSLLGPQYKDDISNTLLKLGLPFPD